MTLQRYIPTFFQAVGTEERWAGMREDSQDGAWYAAADVDQRIATLEAENAGLCHDLERCMAREVALLNLTSAETPVSTLCAICDQIKELHPSTHPWTAKPSAQENAPEVPK